ncbi:hypothetical protein GGX14DRAFT_698580 [Mycena pura]|uniref:Uncharacterized protein n=1 Tax=Mycena pura TaxID=153505 RepID=A0AAD6V7L9_9AGAR|nr:hypothetical protein GGX14DRAFT_698580 [Mycena pura]
MKRNLFLAKWMILPHASRVPRHVGTRWTEHCPHSLEIFTTGARPTVLRFLHFPPHRLAAKMARVSVRLGLLMLWLLAMPARGQAENTGVIQLSSFSNLVIAQCDILTITWTGGTPPFLITYDRLWYLCVSRILRLIRASELVAIEVGDSLFDLSNVNEFTVAASLNSNCLVGATVATATGANPTPNVIQPTDTTSPPPRAGSGRSHSNLAPIVGGAAGGAVALLLIGVCVWYSRRRRQPNNTVLPTTTPGPVFGAHQGMATISGTQAAAPISVTGGVSTQNAVLAQRPGYQTNTYTLNNLETSTGGTGPPPMPTDGPTVSEVPYGQNGAPQSMFAATPVSIIPTPSHRVHSLSSAGGVDGGMRMTTYTGTLSPLSCPWLHIPTPSSDSDSKTVMSWSGGPPSSPEAASSSASPFITPPLREQEHEPRLMLESPMAMNMAPPPYSNND